MSSSYNFSAPHGLSLRQFLVSPSSPAGALPRTAAAAAAAAGGGLPHHVGMSSLHHFVSPMNRKELHVIHRNAHPTAIYYISCIFFLYLVGLLIILVHYMNSSYGSWNWTLQDVWEELKPAKMGVSPPKEPDSEAQSKSGCESGSDSRGSLIRRSRLNYNYSFRRAMKNKDVGGSGGGKQPTPLQSGKGQGGRRVSVEINAPALGISGLDLTEEDGILGGGGEEDCKSKTSSFIHNGWRRLRRVQDNKNRHDGCSYHPHGSSTFTVMSNSGSPEEDQSGHSSGCTNSRSRAGSWQQSRQGSREEERHQQQLQLLHDGLLQPGSCGSLTTVEAASTSFPADVVLENGDIVRHFERAEKPEEINEIVAANQLDSTAVSSCLLINCASVISPLLVGSNSEQQKKRIAAAGSGLKRREEEFSDTNQISYQKNSGCLLETML